MQISVSEKEYTRTKTDMEPENGPLEEEMPFQQKIFLGFHVSTSGVYFWEYAKQENSFPPWKLTYFLKIDG